MFIYINIYYIWYFTKGFFYHISSKMMIVTIFEELINYVFETIGL